MRKTPKELTTNNFSIMNLLLILFLRTTFISRDDYYYYDYDYGSGDESQWEQIINRNNEVASLRENLFTNYSSDIRPVIDYYDSVNLEYGIEVVSLDYFDQKAESIEFNLNMIFRWNDEYLNWDLEQYKVEYISVSESDIWTPDVELYNAGSKPVVYDQKGGMKLYSNGDIMWIRPIRYQFSCKLDLHNFPYDTQSCSMLFGSWKFSKQYFDMKPFSEVDDYLNISVSDDFYHNEWEITEVSCKHEDIEYLCCPGDLWPNSEFTVTLQRSYHKYLVVMVMCLVLVLSGLTVVLMSVKLYRRFYILVFIPLTVIWLQVYIADKIPVLEYSTKLEQYLVMCFTIIMLCTFESGIIYNALTSDINVIKKYLDHIKYFDLFFRTGVIISFVISAIIYISNRT
jgi:nicotinic acetylcholine receptor, invertebrate